MVDQSVKDAFIRLALRMIPIIPANELHDVIISLRNSREDIDRQVDDAVEALKKSSFLVQKLEKTLTERIHKL
jgi:hypothetical protein